MHFITIILWCCLALAIHAFAPRLYATWIVLVGGWLLLPPASYSDVGHPLIFPFWIIGSALPSDLLVTKAWIAPAIALAGSLIFDRARWHRFHFHWTDLAMLSFCLWPIGQSPFVMRSDPAGWLSSIYLTGVWGLSWLIGRVYLRDRQDAKAFAAVLALATLAMLPLMIVEGISTFRFHTLLFGIHPFNFDGIERYVGYRPQLLFEHGNQYGLWCACAAIAGYWRWKEASAEGGPLWGAAFGILLAFTTASQSVGAIVLAILGLTMLSIPQSFKLLRSLGAVGLALSLLAGVLYASGVVPLRRIAETTSVGKAVVGSIRATGRGSFVWRVGQDIKALPIIEKQPVTGIGLWNWFMAVDTRPWGLPLLVLGQFGFIGFVLLAAALVGALCRHLANAARDIAVSRLFTVLLIIFGLDALLNSFIFYPAIVTAAALVGYNNGGQTVETSAVTQDRKLI